MAVTTPAVLFEDVSLAFGTTPILDRVSLALKAGACLCISGPSGNGKTTLLRLVNGLTRPDSGRIVVGDIEVTAPGADLVALRRHAGMVFQKSSLFPHKTALENVTMGQRQILGRSREAAEQRALAVMAQLEIADLGGRYPNALSAGQQQRIALVRALVMDPKVLLLDEVTASLDPRMVEKVAEIVRAERDKGTTVLASSHDETFVSRVATDRMRLEAGALKPVAPPRVRRKAAS